MTVPSAALGTSREPGQCVLPTSSSRLRLCQAACRACAHRALPSSVTGPRAEAPGPGRAPVPFPGCRQGLELPQGLGASACRGAQQRDGGQSCPERHRTLAGPQGPPSRTCCLVPSDHKDREPPQGPRGPGCHPVLLPPRADDSSWGAHSRGSEHPWRIHMALQGGPGETGRKPHGPTAPASARRPGPPHPDTLRPQRLRSCPPNTQPVLARAAPQHHPQHDMCTPGPGLWLGPSSRAGHTGLGAFTPAVAPVRPNPLMAGRWLTLPTPPG